MDAKHLHQCAALATYLAYEDRGSLDPRTYGEAITVIDYYEGRWWAGNCEYSTPVLFCPFCGVELEVPFDTLGI